MEAAASRPFGAGDESRYFCPLNHNVMKHPVSIMVCGDIFDRSALKTWFKKEGNLFCPKCKAEFRWDQVHDEDVLKKTIDVWESCQKGLFRTYKVLESRNIRREKAIEGPEERELTIMGQVFCARMRIFEESNEEERFLAIDQLDAEIAKEPFPRLVYFFSEALPRSELLLNSIIEFWNYVEVYLSEATISKIRIVLTNMLDYQENSTVALHELIEQVIRVKRENGSQDLEKIS